METLRWIVFGVLDIYSIHYRGIFYFSSLQYLHSFIRNVINAQAQPFLKLCKVLKETFQCRLFSRRFH